MEKSETLLSEAEIHAALKADWMATLAQLWEAYGKTIDKKQFRVYVRQLGDLPLGVLEAAVKHLLATHKYNSVPTLAEIMQAVKDTNGESWKETPGYITGASTPFKEAAEKEHQKNRTLTVEDYRRSWGRLLSNQS